MVRTPAPNSDSDSESEASTNKLENAKFAEINRKFRKNSYTAETEDCNV